jgi:hypothetical protein
MSSIPLSGIKRTPVCPTVDHRGATEGLLAACQQLSGLIVATFRVYHFHLFFFLYDDTCTMTFMYTMYRFP